MNGTSPELTVLSHRLSPERLRPYLAAVGGDLSLALDLYAWNSDLAMCLAGTLGHVEIILRNAIHDNLTGWSSRRFGEPRWYLDPGNLLRERAASAVQQAQDRVLRNSRAATPGGIVAELGIGFWRHLLDSRYDGTLWRDTLHKAFPGEGRRRVVHDAAAVVNIGRNRLAHQEPIFNKPVKDIHATALTLAGWICPVSRAWIEGHCLTLKTLARGPLPPFRA